MARVVKTINGQEVKQPTDVGFEDYILTKSGRLASGKMTAERVAKKRKYTLTWAVMSGPQLEQLKSVVQGSSFFFPFVVQENDHTDTVTVYAGAIKRKPARTNGIWYWTNITVDLIEQ